MSGITVYAKLAAVQAALKAPKGQVNKFGNYRYRSAEDILEAVKPLLSENAAALTLSDHIETVGGRIYVAAIAKFIDIDSAECVTTSALAREADEKKGMDPAQVTGSASSYARKYALNGLFAIDDAKDPDTMPPQNDTPSKAVRNHFTRTSSETPNF